MLELDFKIKSRPSSILLTHVVEANKENGRARVPLRQAFTGPESMRTNVCSNTINFVGHV